ncbi:MAG TPA: hypothetical protein VMS22_11500, partial [Candidatus Eisenbacteria bacterium]|nr:hypothetical protein [Candidatus Eisenbacteria bacterium]
MRRAKNAWLALPLAVVAWALVAWAQTAPSFGDFVLFASDSLKAKGLVVNSGDLGANNRFKSTKQVSAPASTIAAGTVQLHPKSTCDELLANSAESGSSCGPAVAVQTPIIPDLAAACGAPSPFPACGSESVTVPHGGQRTLSPQPSQWGNLMVAGGGHGPGTVILEPGSYTFCNIKIGRNAQLLARGPVHINVTGMIKFDNGSFVGPESGSVTPCDVRIFSDGPKVRISRKAQAQAVVCAPKGELELTVGANLEGAFFAQTVDSDRVFLRAPECEVSPTSTTTVTTTSTTNTTSSSTSSSTSTSSTTTTQGKCGNGVVDSGEQCDPSSPSGALLCPEGQVCNSQCQCESTTTTSTSSST